MSRETESGSQQEFPYDISDELGEIFIVEQECPGVWYVSADADDAPLAIEYYIVEKESEVISAAAKAYGMPLPNHPDLLAYIILEPTSGASIIRYEITRYRVTNHLPLPDGETLLSAAVFGREYFPEYFGRYQAPLVTPRGFNTRYWELMHGVFFIETDRCEKMLAVCYPLWKCGGITEYTLKHSKQTSFDREHGIDNTLGYAFFSEQDACLAVFELICDNPELRESKTINVPAPMNAMWEHHPGYAATWNREEQAGLHDFVGELFRSFGVELNENGTSSNLITLYLDAGSSWIIGL